MFSWNFRSKFSSSTSSLLKTTNKQNNVLWWTQNIMNWKKFRFRYKNGKQKWHLLQKGLISTLVTKHILHNVPKYRSCTSICHILKLLLATQNNKNFSIFQLYNYIKSRILRYKKINHMLATTYYAKFAITKL